MPFMHPLLLDGYEAFRTSSYIFAVLAAGVLLVVGAATVSIFGAVRDKTTRLAERVLGWMLLPIMALFFIGLLVVVIWLLVD